MFTFLVMLLAVHLNAQDSLAFGDKEYREDALRGKIYFIPAGTDSLPDFDTLKSRGTVYSPRFDVSARSWTSGFPGVPDRNEWFGIVYSGMFNVKRAGHYTFRLLSDDGARLYIDDHLLIDNDGIHGPVSKLEDTLLDESNHRIRLEYFQGPKTQIALQLFVSFDKEAEQIFPGNYFTLIAPKEPKIPFKTYLVIGAIVLFLVLILILKRMFKRKKKIPETV